jgi:hypothetical protein
MRALLLARDTMLQDVLSQLNGAIRAKRPERPIYIKGAA